MAILEKEVWVTLSGRNIKHYEELGYDIPKYKDSSRRIKVKRGTKILVKIDDLSKRSNVRVTKICDEGGCGKYVPNQKYAIILNHRENGKDRCSECANKKSHETQKNFVKYEKTLEYWSKENKKEYLLSEFSEKNIKKPNQISYGSADKYFWNCFDCGSEYDMSVHHRTSGNNCPFCRGIRVNHTNCLWNTHPEVAKMLVNPERGNEITAGTHKKDYFKCEECGNVDKKMIVNVTRQGFSCSKCSDGVSYPEKFIMNFLDQINVEYGKEKIFEWSYNVTHKNKKLSGRKKYDFYIPSLNLIIEVHGVQHFEKSFETIKGETRTLEEEKENDKLKKEIAEENGMEYIVIDARNSSLEWMVKSINESVLITLFDLSKVNWLKCHEFACSSLVKIVSELWNSGVKSTSKISEIFKCARYTATSYLKQATELGWCDYDPKEEMRKNGKSAKIKYSNAGKKPIVQLTLSGELVREWDSTASASRELNIIYESINAVCKKRLVSGKYERKTAGGYKWMYLEEYKKLNESSLL